MRQPIRLIVAADDCDGIARQGAIPWYIPEDMKRFKALTLGGTVILGRKTWDSLPKAVRPLPGRHNIVLSRTSEKHFVQSNPWNYFRLNSFGDISYIYDECPEPYWIIGGGEVYRAALSLGIVDEIYLTRVKGNFGCDTFWPGLRGMGWNNISTEPAEPTDDGSEPEYAHNDIAYRFEVWKKP